MVSAIPNIELASNAVEVDLISPFSLVAFAISGCRCVIDCGRLSAPVQLLLRHALLSLGKELFDYGCGKGDDMAALGAVGYSVRGWDPFYAAECEISRAHVVNLGFQPPRMPSINCAALAAGWPVA